MESIKYYLEHIEELLLDRSKPLKGAEYFSLVFNTPPTYQDLVSGTPNLAPIFALKPALVVLTLQLVTPRRIELRFPG